MIAEVNRSPLRTAFVDAWWRYADFSSRTTRTLIGNFVFANLLLMIPLGFIFAPTAPIVKFGVLTVVIALWLPLPAAIARRLNDARLPRLLILIPMLFIAGSLAFPLFGFSVESDLIAGEYWIEGQLLEILIVTSLMLLLAKPVADNRFGANPRYG